MDHDASKPVPVQYIVHYEKPKVNHVLHLLLSIITFGLWLPVWLIITVAAAASPDERKVSTVYGPPPEGSASLPEGASRLVEDDEEDDPFRYAKAVGWVGGLLALIAGLAGNGWMALFWAVLTGVIAGVLVWWVRRRA